MEKLNIAELLKDCPKGMELDCALYDNVFFDGIDTNDDNFPISLYYKHNNIKNGFSVTKYGTYYNHQNTKCIIFPKGKTTWEGFHRPFEDGDIITTNRGNICIYKGPMYYNKNLADFYCGYRITDRAFVLKQFKDKHFGDINECRFATKEEKQKLFDAIKANGYRWNAETKTLEKLIEPKFKVGDRVQNKNTNMIGTINLIINDEHEYQVALKNGGITYILFEFQDNWELVPNKFDITTLKPFDKVLVRCNSLEKWHIQFFEKYNTELGAKYPFICLCNSKYCQCIPYEGNEHLLGTTDYCNDFYKTW